MYYPKSQIKPNLYTNGGEFILSTTRKNYKGNYYKISSGKLYSGKNTTDKPNILLLPIPLDPNEEFVGVGERKNMPITFDVSYNQIPQNIRYIPIYNKTYPTDQQIQQGEYTRYFCKKNNELIYIEIDNPTYQLLKNKSSTIACDLYTPTTISWKIGNFEIQSYPQNQSAVLSIERNLKWYGFSQYFKGNFN